LPGDEVMTIVTTARKPNEDLKARAMAISQASGYPYLERGKFNLEELLELHPSFLLLSNEGLSCYTKDGGRLFFHPSMAMVRLKALRKRKGNDLMLEAMALSPGDRVLDCTAGLCSDSLVALWGTGEEGELVALEQSPLIYWVVRYGLEHYHGSDRIMELSRRITLVNKDFREYLREIPPDSFDVIYFDPMFDAPVHASSSLGSLRPLACHDALTPADIAMAARAARKRVVIKQRTFFKFAQLGLHEIIGGKTSPVAYGVLIKEGGEGHG
jgi:hypothetical protein